MTEKKDMYEKNKQVSAEAPNQQEEELDSSAPTRTLWGDAWNRLRKNKLAIIAIVWIIFMVILALSADLWVPQTLGKPNAQIYD
ncbi:MAG: ABC transporter permease, partial [Coriobacteriales bacterium]